MIKNRTKTLQPITKAVFPVAGLGTRFLPATKAVPKEMLPIIDKPLIDFAVEEAIQAGINTLIFVTGRHKRAIEDHFDRNVELELALAAKGDRAMLDYLRNPLPEGIEVAYIRQRSPSGLGDAVLRTRGIVGDEPFALILADEFLPNGKATGALVKNHQSTGLASLAVDHIDGPDISQYGVTVPGPAPGVVAGLVEKPLYDDRPSNWASIGRYVLTPEIFEILANTPPGKGGEVQLADALNILAQRGRVASVPLDEPRYDCGSKIGYQRALLHAIEQRQEIEGWMDPPANHGFKEQNDFKFA